MKYNMNRGSGVSRAPYYITPDIGGERWSFRSRIPIALWMVNREGNEMLIHKKNKEVNLGGICGEFAKFAFRSDFYCKWRIKATKWGKL